jgi:hypothetical protein
LNVKLDHALVALAGALLLVLAWLGIKGGIEQWPASHSLSREVQSAAQLGYGVCSIFVVASRANTGRPAQVIRVAWLACLTVAGGLAPMVWGGSGWASVAVTAVASLAAGCGILWLYRRGLAA